MNKTQEVMDLAAYVSGYANAVKDSQLALAADWLTNLARNVCGQGYIGCRGGEKCGSEHK